MIYLSWKITSFKIKNSKCQQGSLSPQQAWNKHQALGLVCVSGGTLYVNCTYSNCTFYVNCTYFDVTLLVMESDNGIIKWNQINQLQMRKGFRRL